MVVALQGVAVGQSSRPLQRHSAASFSAHPILVLDVHYFLREVAFVHIKIEAIHRDQLGESDVISLLVWLWKSVAKHEHTLLRGVRMEVNVHLEVLILLCVLGYNLFRCPDRGLLSLRRKVIKSIQILPERVESIVTSRHSIRVQCGDHFEDEVLTQELALLASQVGDQIQGAVQHMRPRRLSWVHP